MRKCMKVNQFGRYKCNQCDHVFWGVDLIRTKCSENMVGTYVTDYCPRCLRRGRLGFVEAYTEVDT